MKRDSKLVTLQPRIDVDGLLRCNGRWRYAEILPNDARHPTILHENWAKADHKILS